MEFPAAMFRGKFASQEALEQAWREGLHTVEQITVKSQDEAGAKALLGYVLDPQEMIEQPSSKKRLLPQGKAPADPLDKPIDSNL